MSFIECEKGHLMTEISGQTLKTFTGECAWCQHAINSMTVKFSLAKLKKEGKSMSDFAVFNCDSCDVAMCWDCAKPCLHKLTAEARDEEDNVSREGGSGSAWVVSDVLSSQSIMSDESELAAMSAYFKSLSKPKKAPASEGSKGSFCCIL
mmetsp:Transcript_120227/g.256578  ORF Transcript_120227/g.256578 Transcript_120227/m.256578 type:complete len:150 (-) Transcript_120227:192-641(-)